MESVNIGSYVLDELKKRCTVENEDIGKDAKLDAKGMHFLISRYSGKGVGNLCLIESCGIDAALPGAPSVKSRTS